MWDWFVTTAGEWSLLSMFIRMVAALAVGILIGMDRSEKRKGAGIKTHVLVCLGSAIVMMTSEYIGVQFPGEGDIARMGAQVISGVGFLGVGTIIVTGKNQIKGLTTAAGLWTCACIGLAAGIGYMEGVFLSLVFVLFTFKILNYLDYLMQKHKKVFDLYLEFESNRSIAQFMEEIHKEDYKLSLFELSKSKIKGEGPTAIVTIEVKDKNKRSLFMDKVRNMEGLKYVEEL